MEKQISITKIKIRHSQILLFLNCSKKPETLQGELRFQNAWLNFCHPVAFYPVGKSLVCPIKEGNTQLELYDVRHDLLEEHDVAADHPDVVARMWEFIRASHTEPENPLFKMEIPEV